MPLKQFLFIVVSTSLLLTSCKKEIKVIKQTELSFKKEGELILYRSDASRINFDIEIADTDFDIQTGLMYREYMGDNQAMLFVFENVQPRYFYMKNTKIPLDIIFIDDQMKIVSFQKNAKPLDETSLPSNKPAKYVLEINAGLVDKWQIQVGDRLAYTN